MSQDYKTTADGFLFNLNLFLDLYQSIVERIKAAGEDLSVTSTLIGTAKILINNKDPNSLIRTFITKSQTQWVSCIEKDETKLLSNIRTLFGDVPASILDNTLVILTLKNRDNVLYITAEEKDEIWDFLITFVKLSIVYIHEQRCPKKREDGQIKYSVNFESSISLKKYSELYNIKLNMNI